MKTRRLIVMYKSYIEFLQLKLSKSKEIYYLNIEFHLLILYS